MGGCAYACAMRVRVSFGVGGWGKLQVTGIGTALKILFTPLEEIRLTRHEVVALVNAFGRVSTSLIELEKFRD